MPKTPALKPKKAPQRAKAQAAEHVHASRVAAHLDKAVYSAPKIAETVKAETHEVAEAASETAQAATAQIEKAAAPVVDWFGEGVSRITSAVEHAQELARESLKTFTSSRADTTNRAVALQQKLLSMTQSNVSEGIAALQKLMGASDVKEAIAIQSDYTRSALKTMSDQAKELQELSTQLAEGAHKPLAAQWAKTAEVFGGKSH